MSYPAPNYTQIPNILLEDHIKAMTEAEMRVALAIARKTFGWHKRQDKLSLSQLMDLTGMSRQGVINGIEAGIKRGIIRRERDGQGYLYELVVTPGKAVNEVDQCADESTSQPGRPALVNEVDQLSKKTSQRSRPTKERIVLKEKVNKGMDDDERARGELSGSRRQQNLSNDPSATSNEEWFFQRSQTLPMRSGGRTRQNDPAYNTICAAIESNGFGMMTPIMASKVNELMDTYPTDWILRAMTTAVSSNKIRIDYVEGILKNWKVEGFSNDTRRHHSERSGKGVYSAPTKPADGRDTHRQRAYNERYTSLLADEINEAISRDEAAAQWKQLEAEFPGYEYEELR
ncbi:MAG TPA: replication protein [Candidatus Competibacter phosphatis]|nr:replication protein [Candidatus Competibacter phosphatis]